jgi:hypothetical protein
MAFMHYFTHEAPSVPQPIQSSIKGDLPFHYDSEKKQWIGWEGLDWHLQKKP